MSSGLKAVVQVGNGEVEWVKLSEVELQCEGRGEAAEDEVTGRSRQQ